MASCMFRNHFLLTLWGWSISARSGTFSLFLEGIVQPSRQWMMNTKVTIRQNNMVVNQAIVIHVYSIDKNEEIKFLFPSFTYYKSLIYPLLYWKIFLFFDQTFSARYLSDLNVIRVSYLTVQISAKYSRTKDM
jgi:hypothetical protein